MKTETIKGLSELKGKNYWDVPQRGRKIIKCTNLKEFDYLGTTQSYCVYYIYFGDKFYIGATANISKRIKGHLSIINMCCFNPKAYSNYNKIINHIRDNSIREFAVKIYAFCYSSREMVLLERYLLEKYLKSEKCLNNILPSKKPYNKSQKNKPSN